MRHRPPYAHARASSHSDPNNAFYHPTYCYKGLRPALKALGDRLLRNNPSKLMSWTTKQDGCESNLSDCFQDFDSKHEKFGNN
jgi:hypothetical protein